MEQRWTSRVSLAFQLLSSKLGLLEQGEGGEGEMENSITWYSVSEKIVDIISWNGILVR